MKALWIGLCCVGLSTGLALAQETFSASATLDAAVDAAVRDGLIPGAVLLVGHDGKIVHRKAYGSRALVPAKEAMTVDTIFDIASLTKVVATTPALMLLFEQGKLRINDPVTAYLPEFQGGRSDITVRDLMTHFSGLRPDLDLEPTWSGYETGIRRALIDRPASPAGTRFVYSDINFELLGEIVRRLSGKPLDEYAREVIFEPLEMRETEFHPPASWRARIAPTELDAATSAPLPSKMARLVAAAFGVEANSAAVPFDTLESAGGRRMTAPNHEVQAGLDVMAEGKFTALAGKRVGLITNHTGLDRAGRRNVDVMREAGIRVTALFSPEHGITGKQDQPDVADDKDSATGLPVRSLYVTARYRMTPAT